MGPEERLHRTVCDPLIRIKGSWRSMESTSEEIFEMSSRDYQWVWTQWNQIPKLSNPLGNSTNYAIVLESNNDWQSKTTERHNSSDMTCIISYLITWTLKERIYLTLVYCINIPTSTSWHTMLCSYICSRLYCIEASVGRKSLKTEWGSCMNQESDTEFILTRSSLWSRRFPFQPQLPTRGRHIQSN